MKVDGQVYRTLRWKQKDNDGVLEIIDQRWLPHRFVLADLTSTSEVAKAIKEMWVRGAPLIGATAAYGMVFACCETVNLQADLHYINECAEKLLASRPTAVNLKWAVKRQLEVISKVDSPKDRIKVALQNAHLITEQDVTTCQKIGQHGVELIRKIAKDKKGEPVNILTHCNAGWLACVDWGTATAPIYKAHEEGIPVHVWVDETRPRNQGARITAWELGMHGIPHTIITDNTGGHLMQHGKVDMCIVGTDRTTRTGDVANKIGTYLKALAAKDNEIPFYVALPSTTIDWDLTDGIKEIPIEERNEKEVLYVQGLLENEVEQVLIAPPSSKALNFGFDVTPARLITALITERGLCRANEKDIKRLFADLNIEQ